MRTPAVFPLTGIPKLRVGGIILIAALGVCIYGNHLHNPFQFDTVAYIEKQNLSDPRGMLTFHFFTQQYFSRSLLQMSLALNALLGNKNPFGYHLLNLALHILNAILTFFITEKVLRHFAVLKRAGPERKVGISLFAGLLFLCHPMQTESVLYIMSRSEVLAATCYLLAFYRFQYWLESRSQKHSFFNFWGTWSTIAVLFVLGFSAKQTCITLPAVLFLYALCLPPADSTLLAYLRRWKWVLSVIGITAVAVLFHKLLTDETFLIGPVDPDQMVGRKNYMQSQPYVIVFYYLRLLLFPVNLNIDPDIPVITHLLSPPFLLACSVMALALFLAIRKAASRVYLFGLGWFAIVLSPSSSIVTLHDLAAEHRVYLAAYGIVLTITLLAVTALQRLPVRRKPFHTRPALAMGVLVFLSILTIDRSLDWRSERALWEDTRKKSPHLVRPLINLARAHQLAGDTDTAVELYQASLDKAPGIFITNYNLGELQLARGNSAEALRLLERARILKPTVPEVHGKLGELQQNLGHYEQAARHYRTAVELNPHYAEAFRNLGVLHYYHLGNPELGRLYFSRTLTLNPDQAEAKQIQKLIRQTPPPKGPA